MAKTGSSLRTSTMRSILAVSAFLAIIPTAAAQSTECGDSASQMEMNACAAAEFQQANARLNAVYREITARVKRTVDIRKQLVAAQRAWISFRDAECSFVTSLSEGGSIHPMLVLLCKTRITDKRIAELRPLLTCEDGDLTCPVPPE
jgi:uncharacterized protein YecT (DUF1311 family)